MKTYEKLNLIDGVTVVDKSLFSHIENNLEDLFYANYGSKGMAIDNLNNFNPYQGFILSSGEWGNINESYQHICIPIFGVKPTVSITCNATQAVFYAGLRSYKNPIKGEMADFSEAEGWTVRKAFGKGSTTTVTLPEDVKYLYLAITNNNNSCLPESFNLTSVDGGGLENRVTSLEKIGVNYLALGDSITEGFYSVFDENTQSMESYRAGDNSYVSTLARLKGFNLTNKGVGGSGWLKRGTTSAPKLNAREQIDAKNEDGSYKIDFTKYDLCTLAWGVNDWKGYENLGSFDDGLNPETESVYANIRYCIETIMQRNPNLKLIVISPVNSRRGTSARPQSADHNWGIGYEFNGKTLEDFYDAIKEVCEYYGIEFIDMLHTGVINRLNIETLLPDEVHPSLEAHILMGKELAGKISYGK